MAITSIQAPKEYSPAFNPIIFTFYSDKFTETNFEYFLDVFITGVTFAGGATFLRLKTPPDPTHSNGLFNVADILQRQLSSNTPIVDGGNEFTHSTRHIVEYQVRYGEMYGLSTSGSTAYIGGTTSSYYAFNGSLSALEWKDYDDYDYLATGPSFGPDYNADVKLLTNKPSSGTIRDSENEWLYVMTGTSGAVKFAHINIYTQGYGDKIFVHGYRVINWQFYDPTSNPERRILRFPSGYNILDISAGSIYSYLGTPVTSIPIDSDGITIWEIYFSNSNKDRLTESFWVKKDTLCSTHTEYRLHFKNKWGGYDSFTFTKASQTNTDITRRSYEKVMVKTQTSSLYSYLKSDRFQTSFFTSYKPTIKLNSDWISEAQSVWLEELLTSPEIFIEDATHSIVPVNIIDTKYTQRKHSTDKIFNLSIEIQFTFDEIRQGA